MSENPVLSVDKKTWNKWSFYINVIIFIIIAVFIYLLILDAFNAGTVYAQNDTIFSQTHGLWLFVMLLF